MLHELEEYRRLCTKDYTLADITMVVALRSHDDNPWVLERLAHIRPYYDSLPSVLVVDFGSSGKHSASVAEVCADCQFEYHFVDDSGVFSLAMARNAGAAAARTELIFFNDIDCFGTSNFFDRLLEHLNASEMRTCLETMVNIPVYHLGEKPTRAVASAQGPVDSHRLLEQFNRQGYEQIGPYHYVDGSSNFFVMRRAFFDLVGGYNSNFRGHGSEDFEFLLRYALHARNLPIPQEPHVDLYSPVRDTFFYHKEYRGFRRYGDLLALPAECAGLRLAHLHHPRSETDPWQRNKDYKRKRFEEHVMPFLKQPVRMVGYDWMPRKHRALVLLKQRRHAEYFYPLRLAGYRLDLMLEGDNESELRVRQGLLNGDYDAVAVFNPYMSSHKGLAPMVELARRQNIPLIVTDRGMIPEAWFYAEDMPYADSDYLTLDVDGLEFSEEELSVARAYRDRLCLGHATLENNGDFESTLSRRASDAFSLTCLIPLQLEDDVAVTCFNQGFQAYTEFVAQLSTLLAGFPDVRFLVKVHPLSKRPFELRLRNVQVCDIRDNIHALIELADVVLCYNTGVGFLTLVQGKPLMTVGNAFYNLDGFGHRFADCAAALEVLRSGIPAAPDSERSLKLLAWHIFRKYAFFKGTSEIQEHTTRRAHHYSNLSAYRLPFGNQFSFLTSTVETGFSTRSYAGGRFTLKEVEGSRGASPIAVATPPANKAKIGKAKAQKPAANGARKMTTAERKFLKLMRNPKLFFLDAGTNTIERFKAVRKRL